MQMTQPTFVFFDHDQNFINVYEQKLKHIIPNSIYICSDLAALIQNHPEINSIVSPANSYGFMNGGIDKYIDELFQVEQTVKHMIEKCGQTDDGLRKYLPVGKCEQVKINNSQNVNFLFVTPTMITPQSIQYTNNIELAFLALLNKLHFLQNIVIACPCLGTGVGMMAPANCNKRPCI